MSESKPFDLVLLKVDPEAHPLYFVIRRERYSNDQTAEERAFHRNDDPDAFDDMQTALAAIIERHMAGRGK